MRRTPPTIVVAFTSARAAPAVALATVLVLGWSGCISSESCDAVLCGALPPAVTASVHDAIDGGIVQSAVVNGFPFTCPTACPVQLPDGGFPYQAGSVPLTVSAPGYLTESRTVDVPSRSDDSCCPLLYQPQQIDVALVPL